VADAPAAVTDTHPLLFHAAGAQRLSNRAARHFAACEAGEAILYVPAVVIWEVALLARGGRINLRRPVRAFCDDLFSNPAYQPYDLTPDQIYAADDMRFTRDPFDVLICGAAAALDLPLLTRDAQIRAAGVVRVVW
jgi:PIN domain nuclease of toxin-antitoxin system